MAGNTMRTGVLAPRRTRQIRGRKRPLIRPPRRVKAPFSAHLFSGGKENIFMRGARSLAPSGAGRLPALWRLRSSGAKEVDAQVQCTNPTCAYFQGRKHRSPDSNSAPLDFGAPATAPPESMVIRYRDFRGKPRTFIKHHRTSPRHPAIRARYPNWQTGVGCAQTTCSVLPLRRQSLEVGLPRSPIVLRPAVGYPFVVMLRNSDVNQVELCAAGRFGEVYGQD